MKHLHIADVAAPQPPADLSALADLVDQMAADAADLDARLDAMLDEAAA